MKRLLFCVSLLLLVLNSKAQLIKIDQQSMSSDGALAMQYFRQGEYEKALPLLEKLVSKSNNESYTFLYFQSLLKLSKYDLAEKFIKKQISSNPQNNLYAVALATVYQEKGELQSANRVFNDLIEKLPADEFKIRELANVFYSYANFEYSIKTLKHGQKLLKNNTAFALEIINIYRFKKDKNMLAQEYLDFLPAQPQFLEQAQASLASVFEDKSDYKNFQINLFKKIQKEPDVQVYTELLTWNYIQLQEFDMALRQLIAFDKRSKGDGSIIYKNSAIFIENQAYQTAVAAYEYLITKGKENTYYVPAKIEILNAKYILLTKGKYTLAELELLAKDYSQLLQEFGRNKGTLFAIKKLASLQAYYLNKASDAEKTLEDALKLPGINAAETGLIKLDLGDIYILTQQPWEAFLVYEQVSKQFEGQVLGNEARFKSAKLSFYQGNFDYANSQCLVLKTATSQLIANDALNLSLLITDNTQTPADSSALKMYADAEMLMFRKLPAQAVKKLDSIAIAYPQNSLSDAVLMSKAKILIDAQDYLQASHILKKISEEYKDGIWTDDALFTLADLYENKLKDSEQAKIYYQKLITDYPGSMFNAEARKRFRILRGDTV